MDPERKAAVMEIEALMRKNSRGQAIGTLVRFIAVAPLILPLLYGELMALLRNATGFSEIGVIFSATCFFAVVGVCAIFIIRSAEKAKARAEDLGRSYNVVVNDRQIIVPI